MGKSPKVHSVGCGEGFKGEAPSLKALPKTRSKFWTLNKAKYNSAK